MSARHLVIGQKVKRHKIALARRLRCEPTEAEKLLWSHLRRNQLASLHFRRQQILRGFIVDFYCDEAGLVVELDGPVHEGQREHDRDREAVLSGLGLKIVRFKNEEVMTGIDEVLRKISEAR